MKLLVDQQLPPTLAEWLRSQGHDADHVRDVGLRSASDRHVWDAACQGHSVLITKDVDFLRLQAAGGAASLVWVRIGNCSNALLLARIERSWPRILRRLRSGERLVEVR